MARFGAILSSCYVASMLNIVESLTQNEFSITPHFISPDHIELLSDEVDALKAARKFSQAGIGKTALETGSVRGDLISWVESQNSAPITKDLLSKMESLRLCLNENLFLGLLDFEFHYSIYQAGSFYRKHSDVFQKDDSRVVSAVLYLNRQWNDDDGGQLILYPKEKKPVVVSPTGGTLVCFLSGIEHEVKETLKVRKSFTGWFKRRPK